MINIPAQADEMAGQPQVRQISPTLFVGLGGTGGEVVARIKRKMELYFASNPDQQPRAPMIEYMVVDTARFGLLSQTARAILREGEDFVYIGGVRGEQINNQLRIDRDLGDWIDPNYQAPVGLIDSGANAIRVLSRACLLLSARAPQGITARIQNKLNRIANIDAGMPNPTCEIYLITGGGGGTGSGILWDMAFLLWENAASRFQNVRTIGFILLPYKQAEHIQRQNPYIATRVLANAYALFEELELLLQKPDAINTYGMQARSRAESGRPPVAGWFPFELCYLFDHRLEGVGVFEHLDDLYTYLAKSIYHLFLTPYAAQMQAGLANANTILRNGYETLHRRRTAYSALGFGSIEYPREVILSYLQARYAYEILAKGFLWQGEGLRQIARRHAEGSSGQSGWADKLGRAEVRALEQRLTREAEQRIESNRPRLEQFLERDRRGQPRPNHYDYTQLTSLSQWIAQTVQLAEMTNRRLDAIYNDYAPTAFDKIQTEIHNLINSSPYGLHFAREVLVQADEMITSELIRTRQQIAEISQRLEQIRLQLDADASSPGSIKQIEQAIARKDNRTLQRHFPTFINLLAERLEKEVRLHLARRKEQFLIAVAGEPAGGTVAARTREGIIVGHEIQESILDETRHQLDALIAHIESLMRKAEDATRLHKYYAVAGRELTTVYLPDISSVEQLAQSPEVQQILHSVLPDEEAILKEMQRVMERWQTDAQRLPKLSALDQPDQVRDCLERLLLEAAHAHFDVRVQKSVWQEVRAMPDAQRRELLNQLIAKATPAMPLDLSILASQDQGKITFMWAACSEDPDALLSSLPQEFQHGIAKAKIPKEQIAVIQAVHGFPFHATKHFNDLQIAYNQLLHQPEAYLHLHHRWDREGVARVEGLNQLTTRVDNDTLLVFSLGIFFDRVLRNQLPGVDPTVREQLHRVYDSMFHHDPSRIDAPPVRGLVFYHEGEGMYQALRLEPLQVGRHRKFRILSPAVPLGSSRLSEVLRQLSNERGVVAEGVEFIHQLLHHLQEMPEGRAVGLGWLANGLQAMQQFIRTRYEQSTDAETRETLSSIHACIANFIQEHQLDLELIEPVL